jgi:hypothetical protein
VAFDSNVVVTANAFDRRRVTFTVVHQEPGGLSERVGTLDVGVGELVSRSAAQLRAPPVLSVELSVEPADGAPEGSTSGFTSLDPSPRPPPGQGGAPRPPPGH